MTTLAPSRHKSLDKIQGHIEFRDYQKDGIRWMAKRMNCILAFEMGLGKSLTALSAAAMAFQVGSASRVFVVCPPPLQGNWQEEIERNTNFSCTVLTGSPKKREQILAEFPDSGVDILILAYTQVGKHLDALLDMQPDIIIADEAHQLKGHKSKRTNDMHALGRRTPRCFLLTGTPMLNWPSELWSLLFLCKADSQVDDDDNLVYPEVIKYWSFFRRFVKTIGEYNTPVAVKNEGRLTEILDDYMLRRTKAEVAKDLPEKVHVPIWVDLHPKQKKLYDQATSKLLIQVDEADDDSALHIDSQVVLQTRLMQICSTTATLTDEDYSSKIDVAIDTAKQLIEAGEWTIIFTQFRPTIRSVVSRLVAEDIDTFELHGDVPNMERVPTVNRWASNDRPAVMVAGLQVAGVGLNMTKSSSVIFVDKLYVPGLNEQAVDRVHRIGATADQVMIYDILARDTVEEDKEEILNRKKGVFEVVMPDGDMKAELLRRTLERARREEG